MNKNDFNFRVAREYFPERFVITVVTEKAVMSFENINEAKKHIPELSPLKSGQNFTDGMFDGWFDGKDGKTYPIMRFEDWKTYERLSK